MKREKKEKKTECISLPYQRSIKVCCPSMTKSAFSYRSKMYGRVFILHHSLTRLIPNNRFHLCYEATTFQSCVEAGRIVLTHVGMFVSRRAVTSSPPPPHVCNTS
jgi:hypothetical protein